MTQPQGDAGRATTQGRQAEDDARSIHTVQTEAADWVPDCDVASCMRCRCRFSFPLKRRHHCRKCGEVVCSSCSRTRQLVPEYHATQPQRVCRKCVDSSIDAGEPLLEGSNDAPPTATTDSHPAAACKESKFWRPPAIKDVKAPVPSGLAADFGILRLHIIEAKGLVAADMNWRGQASTSDPYCIVSLKGGPRFRTRDVRSTLEPMWEETLGFQLGRSNATLDVQLMDADAMNGDDPIGSVKLSLGELRPGRKVRGWVPITPVECQEEEPHGGLLIEMQLVAFEKWRHFMSYVTPPPSPKKDPPPFDINAIFGPSMHLMDLLWTRLACPLLFSLLDLLFWKDPKWSFFVLVMWNVMAARFLAHWPALLLLALVFYMLSWRATKAFFDPEEAYVIENVNAMGMFVNVEAGKTCNGANIQLWDNHESNDTRWRIQKSNGIFTIENVHAGGKYLSVSTSKNGANVRLSDKFDSDSSRWRIVQKSHGVFSIESVYAEAKFLNVCGGGTHHGANIQVWTNPASTHSLWRIRKQSTGKEPTGESVSQQTAQPKIGRSLTSGLLSKEDKKAEKPAEDSLGSFVATVAMVAPKFLKDLGVFFTPLLRLAADGCQLIHDVCTWEHPGSPAAALGLVICAAFCEVLPFFVIVMFMGSAVLLACSPLLTAAIGCIFYAQWWAGSLNERKAFGMHPEYQDEWSSVHYKPKATKQESGYRRSSTSVL